MFSDIHSTRQQETRAMALQAAAKITSGYSFADDGTDELEEATKATLTMARRFEEFIESGRVPHEDDG